ncbi:hypothetical protein pb186bvf_010396 [Paramecium bursaria]
MEDQTLEVLYNLFNSRVSYQLRSPMENLKIGVAEPNLQMIIVECYQCKNRNSCSCKAQFMKCAHCQQINRIFDPDPAVFFSKQSQVYQRHILFEMQQKNLGLKKCHSIQMSYLLKYQ